MRLKGAFDLKKKLKIAAALIFAALFIFLFVFESGAPKRENLKTVEETKTEGEEIKADEELNEESEVALYSPSEETEEIKNDNTPEESQSYTDEEDKKDDPAEKSCTLYISCKTALGKTSLSLPEDGVILPETKVTLDKNDTVFSVLSRTLKEKKIHMEYVDTAVSDSAYIEGIANLYEFDAGELSGWMYSVNGVFPNVGVSSYEVSDGDKISFLYTCDLGKDLGAEE